ncbi:MAG: hypothetical protein KJO36_05270, partial [Acidimicrobiia bacterium]|nr:hypothetical protein [Acidimicrobiia bacterium]
MKEQNLTEPAAFDRLFVLLDPSSKDGEDGAALALTLMGEDGHMQLAVAMSGPEAWALDAFAESEAISTKEAAGIYLDQAAARLGGNRVDTTTIEGIDLANELVHAAEEADAGVVVLPAILAARVMASKQ